ncbi:MAG TPA: PorV/PorQ family protein, partial [Candidatus Krumholzibacterium sp.]|nr:PorV/PorQ family protein [Candidatus Krumholzibacterium sp.]
GLILLLGVFRPDPARAGEAGTGLTFLSLGVSARRLGMGEAYIAVPDDPSSMHFNPAALSLVDHTALSLMHREWIQDTDIEYIAGGAKFNKFALGFSVYYVSIPDIEIRSVPGPPVGTFSARNAALGLSAAYDVSEALAIGATAKYVYEKILVDDAGGMVFDIGGVYSTPHGIRLGLSLLNLGSISALRYESSTPPRSFRGGASYTGELSSFPAVLTASMDVISPLEEGSSHVHVGGEAKLYETIAIRIGYQTGYDARDITLGTGFTTGIVTVDYAFVPTRYDLGSTHAFSLTLAFR